jgi:chromatin remodeling complex protein RSC6
MTDISVHEQILIELKKQNAMLEEQLRPQREADAHAAQEIRRAKNAIKPRLLSLEMCNFMQLPAGSKQSQVDVTKFISNYVKSHNCFDPNFKRRIYPDARLAKLFNSTDNDEITYLNLQTYLKVHYVKK